MKDPQTKGGRVGSPNGLSVRVLALRMHVCLLVLCMSLQNLGEESLLILALGHNLSLPSLHPWISIHPLRVQRVMW